jgi:hypothetical protein
VRFCFATFAHGTAGAARTRSSLRPLLYGANEFAKLGRSVSRECEGVFGDRSGAAAVPHITSLMRLRAINVIARSACDEAIQLFAARIALRETYASGSICCLIYKSLNLYISVLPSLLGIYDLQFASYKKQIRKNS